MRGGLGDAPFLVDGFQRQYRHRVSETDDQLHVFQVVPVFYGAFGETQVAEGIEYARKIGHIALTELEFPWRRLGAPEAPGRRVETVGACAGKPLIAIVQGEKTSKVRRHVGYPYLVQGHVGQTLGQVPSQLLPSLDPNARAEDRFLAGVRAIGDGLSRFRGVL